VAGDEETLVPEKRADEDGLEHLTPLCKRLLKAWNAEDLSVYTAALVEISGTMATGSIETPRFLRRVRAWLSKQRVEIKQHAAQSAMTFDLGKWVGTTLAAALAAVTAALVALEVSIWPVPLVITILIVILVFLSFLYARRATFWAQHDDLLKDTIAAIDVRLKGKA
jgi:uncharacterized protein YacL